MCIIEVQYEAKAGKDLTQFILFICGKKRDYSLYGLPVALPSGA